MILNRGTSKDAGIPNRIGRSALWLCIAASAWAQFPNRDARIGANLDFVDDTRPAWVFVDVFKSVRTWEATPKDSLLLTDDEGWIRSLAPGQTASAHMLTNLDGHYPEGQYVCLYDGKGKLSFDLDGAVVSEMPGRVVLDVAKGSMGIVLTLQETDTVDPVRNIRVIMPGFEETYQTHVFHPAFLESLRRYGVLRFMNFQRTNGSDQESWAERATPGHFGQGTDRGVALEYMIALCNRTGMDAWLCLPHRANDDYVRQFAAMVRAGLDPSLRVYVEYSNEVWNRQFDQATFSRNKGLALGLSKDPKIAQFRFYSQRSVEVFRIWEEVFGGAGRLVRVLSTQQADEKTGREIMDWRNAYEHADALGVAPYFGGILGDDPGAPFALGATMEQIMDACREDMARVRENTRRNAENAAARGLELIAYEGGQHLAATGPWRDNVELRRVLVNANRHPGMRDLYREDLRGWASAGGQLFMLYTHTGRYNRYGSWGLIEWQDAMPETAYKVLGVSDFFEGDTGTLDVSGVPANRAARWIPSTGLIAMILGMLGVTGVAIRGWFRR